MTRPATYLLRDVIAEQLDQQWSAWAHDHPHLAAAIDRTRLIDTATARLRDDPAFNEALRRANLDEARLAEAARVLDLAKHWVRDVLPGLNP